MPADTPELVPSPEPAATAAGTLPARPGQAVPPDPSFPEGYERREEVGRGNMGVVYRARDRALARDVAVKLVHDRFPADGRTAARFVEEARIAAQLQHPGIPPIHHVGHLPDGRPFLVMKLIKGRNLKELLGERAEPADGRGRFVAVFEAIAQAVGYAHERRVIHRDLKPANVMVGAFGEVQVMDWGLAKVLVPRGAPGAGTASDADTHTVIAAPREAGDPGTQYGVQQGTPAFMAPEQAVGAVDLIDERSDVFGLGAILCAVLTGRPPFQGGGPQATMLLAARGDLADAFARLDACGADAELVRLAKACLAVKQDDRPANGGEVARAVAGWRVAAEERARQAAVEQAAKVAAEAARDRARQLYQLALDSFNQMVFGVQSKLARRAGTLDLQLQVLSVARAGLQQLVGEAERHGSPDRTLIWTHFQMGDVHLALGDDARARREYESGFRLADRWADPGDAQTQRDLGVGLSRLGLAAHRQNRLDEAGDYYARALDVRRRLAAAPADAQAQRDLGATLERLGDLALQRKRYAEAEERYARALDVRHRLADAGPPEAQPHLLRDLGAALERLGDVALQRAEYAEAQERYARALDVRRRLAGADPDGPQAQSDLGSTLGKLGHTALKLGMKKKARELHAQELDLRQRLVTANPDDAQAARDLALSLGRLGEVALELGWRKQAREFYTRELEVRQRLAHAEPAGAAVQRELLAAHFNFGNFHQKTKNLPEAIACFERARAVASAYPRPDQFAAEVEVIDKRLDACRRKLGAAPPDPG